MTTSEPKPAENRHASWVELFFDLVCVAAMIQLTHALGHEPGWLDIGRFVVMYYAIWSLWTSFTLYGNIRGDKIQVRFMIYGMVTLGAMAASVPEADADRANTFATFYFVARIVTSKEWGKSGSVITAWPAAQLGFGAAPWIISLWVDTPWKFALWGLGAVLDIVFSIVTSRDPDRMVAGAERERERRRQRLDRLSDRRARQDPRRTRGDGRDPLGPKPTAVDLHDGHLAERTGLFMIIVLGEAVIQVVHAAGEENWDRWLGLAVLGGFGLVVCLWWLTFSFGVLAVPQSLHAEIPTPLALPSHFAMTASVVAMAAGTGTILLHPHETAPTAARWLLCAGVAVFFGNVVVSGLVLKAPWQWVCFAAVPAVLIAVALGGFGGPLPGWALSLGVLAAALWTVLLSRPRVVAGAA